MKKLFPTKIYDEFSFTFNDEEQQVRSNSINQTIIDLEIISKKLKRLSINGDKKLKYLNNMIENNIEIDDKFKNSYLITKNNKLYRIYNNIFDAYNEIEKIKSDINTHLIENKDLKTDKN